MPAISKAAARIREAAHKVYEERLRAELEPAHVGEIIAVEPESGAYVLDGFLDEFDRAFLTVDFEIDYEVRTVQLVQGGSW